MLFPENSTKLILDVPQAKKRHDFEFIKAQKRAAVERDVDDLTTDEYDIHIDEVVNVFERA